MGKFARIFIAIVVVLSFVIWARSDPAGAANPALGSDPSVQAQADQSVSADDDDECKDKKNKDKDKCKCKDDKGKGKKDCGTVKPPDDDIDVCDDDDFSVGGVATLKVKRNKDKDKKDDDCFHAETRKSDELKLPKGAGNALSDQVLLTSVDQGTSIKICFAAPPGKKVKIYTSGGLDWKALKTEVKGGSACADVPGSGSVILAGG